VRVPHRVSCRRLSELLANFGHLRLLGAFTRAAPPYVPTSLCMGYPWAFDHQVPEDNRVDSGVR
jgi:hypothetical protein